MDLHSSPSSSPLGILSFTLTLLLLSRGGLGATFTFVNKCGSTVWPGILANAGSPSLESTGFELSKGSSRTIMAPTGWSGRFWGRTGCKFDDSGSGSCGTGDCASGQVECNGAGAAPPATLAEITLGTGGQDFYDVSLVDGYNMPLVIEASGGSGMCATTGCVTDLNQICPSELKMGDGEGCRSACEAFSKPEYCCSGAYSTPTTCKPSVYSQMFKSACPRSYSYAYDDPTSTFTCSGADYTVTFCPSLPSQKSSKDTTTQVTPTTGSGGSMSGSGSGSGIMDPETEPGTMVAGTGMGIEYDGSGMDGQTGTSYTATTTTTAGSGSGSEAMLADGSYLAGLAMGDSTRVLATNTLLLYYYYGAIAFALLFIQW
ncbi:PREDICTED: thaumatin-like protein 1 [Ipomoea nil]|uniref:thaumatin-like protein 1 n=1 Tax=Ipomoea nil TaxID=35883 RepID=UPI0009008524|nr:PREDICTED: thaumatin-like protein 1 [Ipomoea nil]